MARDSLYLDGNVLGRRALEDEAAARQRAGFEVTRLDAAAVERRFGIAGRSGLLSYDNLSADPRRLAHGFLAAAIGRGARVCSPVDIAKVGVVRGGVRAWTSDGRVVHARHLVFATGYELARGVPTAGHAIASTWAIATRPQPRRLWPERCFIWEASDPYLYLRVGPDGRIICGGEDEEFADEASRDALLARKTATLERKLHALLPDGRSARRVRLVWQLRRIDGRDADDRPDPRDATLLRRARLRRQRHHVRGPGRAAGAGRHRRPSRSRCRSVRVRSGASLTLDRVCRLQHGT